MAVADASQDGSFRDHVGTGPIKSLLEDKEMILAYQNLAGIVSHMNADVGASKLSPTEPVGLQPVLPSSSSGANIICERNMPLDSSSNGVSACGGISGSCSFGGGCTCSTSNRSCSTEEGCTCSTSNRSCSTEGGCTCSTSNKSCSTEAGCTCSTSNRSCSTEGGCTCSTSNGSCRNSYLVASSLRSGGFEEIHGYSHQLLKIGKFRGGRKFVTAKGSKKFVTASSRKLVTASNRKFVTASCRKFVTTSSRKFVTASNRKFVTASCRKFVTTSSRRIVTDNSRIVATYNSIFTDSSGNFVTNSSIVTDSSKVVTDSSMNFVTGSSIVTDDSRNFVTTSSIVTDGSRNLVTDSRFVTDGNKNLVTDSSIVTNSSRKFVTDNRKFVTDSSIITDNSTKFVTDSNIVTDNSTKLVTDSSRKFVTDSNRRCHLVLDFPEVIAYAVVVSILAGACSASCLNRTDTSNCGSAQPISSQLDHLSSTSGDRLNETGSGTLNRNPLSGIAAPGRESLMDYPVWKSGEKVGSVLNGSERSSEHVLGEVAYLTGTSSASTKEEEDEYFNKIISLVVPFVCVILLAILLFVTWKLCRKYKCCNNEACLQKCSAFCDNCMSAPYVFQVPPKPQGQVSRDSTSLTFISQNHRVSTSQVYRSSRTVVQHSHGRLNAPRKNPSSSSTNVSRHGSSRSNVSRPASSRSGHQSLSYSPVSRQNMIHSQSAG